MYSLWDDICTGYNNHPYWTILPANHMDALSHKSPILFAVSLHKWVEDLSRLMFDSYVDVNTCFHPQMTEWSWNQRLLAWAKALFIAPFHLSLILALFQGCPEGYKPFSAITDLIHSYFTTVRPIASKIYTVLPYYIISYCQKTLSCYMYKSQVSPNRSLFGIPPWTSSTFPFCDFFVLTAPRLHDYYFYAPCSLHYFRPCSLLPRVSKNIPAAPWLPITWVLLAILMLLWWIFHSWIKIKWLMKMWIPLQ